MLAWTADRGRYGAANLAMIASLLVSGFVLGVTVSPAAPSILTLASAILWNIVSYRRISDARLWFLHAAPWITLAGFYAVIWGAAASEGQYETGLTWKQAIIPYSGLVGLLAWPAATSLLSTYERKRA